MLVDSTMYETKSWTDLNQIQRCELGYEPAQVVTVLFLQNYSIILF